MEDYFFNLSKSNESFIDNKITKTLEERLVRFWCKIVWSGNVKTSTKNVGNKLKIYRYFKKSSKFEDYLINIKDQLHRKAFCQCRISSHSLVGGETANYSST